MKKPEYEIRFFATQKEWEKWLSKNHHSVPGVWLKFAKKNSGVVSTNYSESLEIALCYGWIDSQVKALDEKFYLQKFTPRGPRSIWSKINTIHIERLLREGRMQPAGIAQVEAAKKDGRWAAAYDSPKEMEVPNDFIQLLSKNKKAEEFFKTLNKTNTFAIGWRLQTSKKAETRQRRMRVILEMLQQGKKIY